jgi:glycosyltransferase involved in cell wall biosynthesis
MKVSVLTPTRNRESYIRNLYTYFKAQRYSDKELIILDDSPHPSLFFQNLNDPEVRYIHSDTVENGGQKRNRLIGQAGGEVLVHFDDDDYYAPHYIQTLVDHLGDADLVTLSGWFGYAARYDRFYYWDTRVLHHTHVRIHPYEGIRMEDLKTAVDDQFIHRNVWGFGFSYVFRKRVCSAVQFDETLHFGFEDYPFARAIIDQGFHVKSFPDEVGLVIHVNHLLNVSIVYPQFILPEFVVCRYFGDEVVNALRQLDVQAE